MRMPEATILLENGFRPNAPLGGIVEDADKARKRVLNDRAQPRRIHQGLPSFVGWPRNDGPSPVEPGLFGVLPLLNLAMCRLFVRRPGFHDAAFSRHQRKTAEPTAKHGPSSRGR